MSKLRILCLHGFTSNGSVHAHQIRGITKALSAEYEFLFPVGPHEVEITENPKLERPSMKSWSEYVSKYSTSGHRGWWVTKEPNPANGEQGTFEGLEKSLKYIGDFIHNSGPVHAIWGFSQGACFAGMLMALLSLKQMDNPLRNHLPCQLLVPSAGIFIAGFKARFPQYDSAYASGIDVPTLHVIGSQDVAVVPERSEALVKISTNPSVLRHGGGHNFPVSEEDQKIIIDFLRQNVRVTSTDH
ncbi:uncharacterized protein RAG0_07157 [Rhynchosporium agropyri]|uniref:Serine hydrolase domain-containing protein n=1 Tax=Rhynchosporium agropyri TaxID=914238 RepID=A0A1E1KK13_9HELO|nr:uncharacterized protein RAG0_07157 [Rhynchosporium agropyri]